VQNGQLLDPQSTGNQHQFAALWDGDITVDDLTLYITTNIRIPANCQNAVRGCNVTFQISIEDELVCKLV
jgi:hypothetical protein